MRSAHCRWLLTAALLVACGPSVRPSDGAGAESAGAGAEDARPGPGNAEAPPLLEVVAQLDQGPGNLTVQPDGRVVMSLHQFYGHDDRVVTLDDGGKLRPFAGPAGLDSVLGLQADSRGTVWLLDNAMRGGGKRRLVGWNEDTQSVVADIDLSAVTPDDAFVNDLVIDLDHGAAYIADPAGGANAAIVVVDLTSGAARRVLEGHGSVVAEDLDLVIDGNPVRIRQADGSEIRPRIGVNPIAADAANEWLYFGPMHGSAMYRVKTSDLRDPQLSADALGSRVERYSDKPICDGISIDAEGNIYLGDLARNAIGVIRADRSYSVLLADPRLSWVDAFSAGPDGYLYLVVNQLHRTAVLNGGTPASQPPYLVARFKPFAPGTTGR